MYSGTAYKLFHLLRPPSFLLSCRASYTEDCLHGLHCFPALKLYILYKLYIAAVGPGTDAGVTTVKNFLIYIAALIGTDAGAGADTDAFKSKTTFFSKNTKDHFSQDC